MRKLILILAAVAAVAVGGTAAFAQTAPIQTAAAGKAAQPVGINWFGPEYMGGA
jgi:hypothetical protein